MAKNDGKKLRILAAGDIHGDVMVAERLAKKAKRNNVDLVLLLGDIYGLVEAEGIIGQFKKEDLNLCFIPGNWDSSKATKWIEKTYQVKNLDGYCVMHKGRGITGVGCPDWNISLGGNKTLATIKYNFDKLDKHCAEKKILISHLHAAGTKAEFSGMEGNTTLRKAITDFKPDLFLSAHIHEAEGIEDKIGKTKVVCVGENGTVIEI